MFIEEMVLLDDHIILQRREVKKTTKSGIIKSDNIINLEKAQEVEQAGLKVLKVNTEEKDIKAGDYVLVMPHTTGIGLTVADFDYNDNVNIVSRSSIYAIVTKTSKNPSEILT